MTDSRQCAELDLDRARKERLGSRIIRVFYNAAVYSNTLIHIDPILLQLFPCHIDLPHQFLMRFRYIIECENAPPQLEEEIGTEGYESPERELLQVSSALQ